MKLFVLRVRFMVFSSTLFINGLALAETVLEKMPENRSLKTGQVVYVENDGRCEKGMVLRVTGGSKSKGINRRVECVPKPE